jgi:WD40 repeat protein
MLASGGEERMIHLWDVATGKELRQLQGSEGWTLGLAFSPDGTRLGSVSHTMPSGDTWVYLWNPATGKEVSRIPKGETALLGDPLMFSPDGKQLATMGAKWVRFWDAATGKELRRVDGRSWFALSPDGSTLVAEAVTGKGFTLRDIATGQERRRFGERDAEPTFERSFALSPDGKTLAAPGKGGTVRLYDLATGKERWRFEGHAGFITSVVFSPDGRRLLTGSWDS